jgi:hypothetical protein
VSIDVRLTSFRRAAIARALEASEYPDRLDDRAAVAAAWNEVKAAIAAARRIDPSGHSTAGLRTELARRLRALADRLDVLWAEDRQHVVAHILALAALARAAGRPVHPLTADRVRDSQVDGGAESLLG